ncbi:hypothetical protein AB0D59_27785 [Streptomyces sp. NPDC048417]
MRSRRRGPPVRDRSTRRAQVECSLNELLRTFDPEEIAGAAARRIRP